MIDWFFLCKRHVRTRGTRSLFCIIVYPCDGEVYNYTRNRVLAKACTVRFEAFVKSITVALKKAKQCE